VNAESPPAVAARIGGNARRFLSAAPRAGRVVSGFSSGVNLLFGEGSSRTLLALQGPALALHPWAIEVDLSAWPLTGTAVTSNSKTLRCIGFVEIDLTCAEVDALRIEPYAQHAVPCALDRLAGIRWTTEPTNALFGPIDAVLDTWRTSGHIDDLASLIGLGPGSTPAGDDVLVGILAGLAAVGQPSVGLTQGELRPVLGERLKFETPLGSEQMLRAALEGSFPEPLVWFVSHLAFESAAGSLQDAAERLERLGATSGRAMAAGLRAAFAALSRRHEARDA